MLALHARMDSYVLFKGAKRVSLMDDDMTTEKISRIFQVHSPSLYITDDSNVAVFPTISVAVHFSILDLVVRGHYEVHGDSICAENSTEPLFVPPPTKRSSGVCCMSYSKSHRCKNISKEPWEQV
ncbi:uncharacterized protein LOC127376411 [Xyrichtys novacula]|uniref:Uncharacterized protein LOC127376411 n=1 Tax=Xyrichtys novacula TaxID=13765 RepID=A0AAV1F7Y5_XYRNO|nr:uncharacterized protein LOC127376411 [Xyrichtys novacula]